MVLLPIPGKGINIKPENDIIETDSAGTEIR